MKKILAFSMFVILAIVASTISCKKDDDNNDDNNNIDSVYTDNSVTLVQNSMTSDDVYYGAVTSVVSNADNQGGKSTCPTVSFTQDGTTEYPKTLTLDFGTGGCTYGEVTVAGKIIASLSGKIREEGTTVAITFENYKVDTIEVGGTLSLTVQNFSLPLKTVTFIDSVKNGVLTVPSGTMTLTTNQTIKWIFNEALDYTDDEFEISNAGTSATTIDGESYTTSITEPITIKSCSSIYQAVQGVYEISTSELTNPVVIDFGDGTCDNVATVSTEVSVEYNGQTFSQDYSYEIPLP